jgi:molybdopterin converting factor small subunit
MNKENENSITPQNSALNIADVMAMLPYDSKMEELIRSRSQLYSSYSVKDKEGKYRGVVDIESVVELLREVLGN